MSELIVKFHHDEHGIARSWEETGKIIRCKDCKYFHYDKPYVVYDIPVLGHEVCDKWGRRMQDKREWILFHGRTER